MEVDAARAVLGVAASASPEELRAAYRARLREAHPDLRGRDAGTAEVVAAYRLLRDLPPETVPVPVDVPTHVGVVVEGDTVTADLPAGDLFQLLMAAGESVGEVAYVDPHAGILEVVVELGTYGACSVVLTLQGRGVGVTEAWATVEPLGGGPVPPTSMVTHLLADGLRSVADR